MNVNAEEPRAAPRHLAAVIEIGSSSIRMAIGQRVAAHRHTLLAGLDLPVGIGRESFTAEQISPETTERCVAALQRFRKVLDEHGVTLADTRVVATSAVREARNRDMFTDRLLIATGLRVEVLDETEVNRLTYLAVRPALRREGFFRRSSTLVVEVGGGSTEILAFRQGRMHAAQVHRLGSLRMLRELGDLRRAPGAPDMLADYLAAPIEQIVAGLGALAHPVHLVALGSEPRLVYQTLERTTRGDDALTRLDAERLRAFVAENEPLSPAELAREHGISEHQAETLLPALAIYLALAEALGARGFSVASASLRDGVLTDLFAGGAWEAEFRRQTISSSLALARKYHVNLAHARQVALRALQLFAFMQRPARFEPEDETLLHVAALLHEIGMFVNPRSFHKHSLYLLQNSEIFGLSAHAITLVAHIARYHRRATPRPTHEEFSELPAADRIRVVKLAAILRVADALDFAHEDDAAPLAFELAGDLLRIGVGGQEDLTLIARQLEARAEMFRMVYGLRITVVHFSDGDIHGQA